MRCLSAVIVFALLFSCSSCEAAPRAGGKLPLLASEWTEETDGDVWFTEDSTSGASASGEAFTGQVSVGDDVPVTRAAAAKMMALAHFSMEEINGLPVSIPFSDVPTDAWYAKYVNAVYSKQLMLGYNNEFMPDEYLTLGQAYLLLEPDIAEPTDGNKNTAVSYALWVDLYMKELEKAGRNEISAANIILMEYNAEAAAPLLTNAGAFSCDGLDLRGYMDRELRVLHKDGEIAAVTSIVNDIPTIRNAFVLNADERGATVFSGGSSRYYEYGNDAEPLPAGTAVGDFVVFRGKIMEAVPAAEKITGTILRTTNRFVELKEWGLLPIDANFKTYASAGEGAAARSYDSLIVGTGMADFYIKNNALCAAVITGSVSPETIRVAIGTSGYAGLIHENVSVTSDAPFTVTAGKVVKKFTAGQRFTVNKLENTDLFGQPRLFVTFDEPEGFFQITSVKRAEDVKYRGALEIAAEDGGYSVVNELPLEEYLYSVVPSEMPGSFGLQAAMVQAVTARSYAYNQFYENRFHAYGANVDDSVSCQVYNNIPETELSVEAVRRTAGQCLTYLGRVISANFFSTSAGVTANSGDVWPSPGGRKFPNETQPYLKSQSMLVSGADPGDLSREDNARKFLTDTEVEAYDSGFGWFRWQVEMTAAELAASINANLPGRYAASPGTFVAEKGDISNGIGELISLDILKRGQGGNIMEMRVVGTLSTFRVLTEYNVRVLLAPKQYVKNGRDIIIYRADGTYVENYSLMPSAFFVIEDGYKFVGGGNGHGVGMSQTGVKGMADLGFTFDQILEKFYPGTEVAVMGGL